jgi:hypothetical protein
MLSQFHDGVANISDMRPISKGKSPAIEQLTSQTTAIKKNSPKARDAKSHRRLSFDPLQSAAAKFICEA